MKYMIDISSHYDNCKNKNISKMTWGPLKKKTKLTKKTQLQQI